MHRSFILFYEFAYVMDFEEKFLLERGKTKGFLGFPNPVAGCSDIDWVLGWWSFLVLFLFEFVFHFLF